MFWQKKIVNKESIFIHLCSRIIPYAIHSLESIIVKMATCKISVLQLVSVAKQSDLSLTWSQTLEEGSFIYVMPYCSFLLAKLIMECCVFQLR